MAKRPFKMKASPGGPMKKNFPSIFKKTTDPQVAPSKGVKDFLKDKDEKELSKIAKRNLKKLNVVERTNVLDNLKNQMAYRDTLAGVRQRGMEILRNKKK